MLAVLLLTSALALPTNRSTEVADLIGEAQIAYRNCIAEAMATRPLTEGADLALAAALEQCRDAELALRAQTKADPDATAADTLAIVLDTRMEGEEAGRQQRQPH